MNRQYLRRCADMGVTSLSIPSETVDPSGRLDGWELLTLYEFLQVSWFVNLFDTPHKIQSSWRVGAP
jgi:hypothetical protein